MHILLNACEDYMLKREVAENIIQEVAHAVKDWRCLAIELGIPKREIDLFADVLDHRVAGFSNL